MRRFRTQRRPDTVSNQERRGGLKWTRYLYLAILAGLVLWLGDFLVGSYLYLNSEGMVVAPQVTLATEFPATVRDIDVREGDRVTQGEQIATVSSQHVAESVARLTTDSARLRAEEADMRVQMDQSAALVHAAAARSSVANDIRKRYETLERQGILPSDKRLAAVESEYRSLADLEGLKAKVSAMREQLKQLSPAVDEATSALRDLEALYANGVIKAPINGIVGHRNVEPGAVVMAGDPILQIYGNKSYVLAYLPTGTLYTVKKGESVMIDWGVRHARGHIAAIEPVAVELPKEFQTAFKPVARSQILRIEFDDLKNGTNDSPPLFTKVRIYRRGYLRSLWSALF